MARCGMADRYSEDRNAVIPQETQSFIVKVKHNRDIYAKLYGDDLGGQIGDRLRVPEPQTLWDKIFGWIFK